MYSILGLSVALPSKKYEISNLTYPMLTEKERQRFVKVVGIEKRRWGSKEYCSSDYCAIAAEKLINELGIKKEEIGVLIYVTQTPDYLTPATSCVLQTRLGLASNVMALDINLGCSGFTHGLIVASALMNAFPPNRYALILCGDTPSKMIHEKDQATSMLFSDAGSACILSHKQGGVFAFNYGADGSGAQAINVKAGFRNGFDLNTDENGKNSTHLNLNGEAVMDFTLQKIPAHVKNTIDNLKTYIPDVKIDNYFFHQANKVVNDAIASQLGLNKKEVPSTLKEYGNTSSASIPLTMVSMGQEYFNTPKNILLCGFGVGLSWSSIVIKTDKIKICDLIEVE